MEVQRRKHAQPSVTHARPQGCPGRRDAGPAALHLQAARQAGHSSFSTGPSGPHFMAEACAPAGVPPALAHAASSHAPSSPGQHGNPCPGLVFITVWFLLLGSSCAEHWFGHLV